MCPMWAFLFWIFSPQACEGLVDSEEAQQQFSTRGSAVRHHSDCDMETSTQTDTSFESEPDVR